MISAWHPILNLGVLIISSAYHVCNLILIKKFLVALITHKLALAYELYGLVRGRTICFLTTYLCLTGLDREVQGAKARLRDEELQRL